MISCHFHFLGMWRTRHWPVWGKGRKKNGEKWELLCKLSGGNWQLVKKNLRIKFLKMSSQPQQDKTSRIKTQQTTQTKHSKLPYWWHLSSTSQFSHNMMCRGMNQTSRYRLEEREENVLICIYLKRIFFIKLFKYTVLLNSRHVDMNT